MNRRKVYVASSWRCSRQPMVVEALRKEGHYVYDFRNPKPGKRGFSWHDIDPSIPIGPADLNLPAHRIRSMLADPAAEAGFKSDMNALRECDICVLVLPCGRSAHLEAGWAAGVGKLVIVLLDDGEPDLMWKMAPILCVNVEEVISACRYWVKESSRAAGPGDGLENPMSESDLRERAMQAVMTYTGFIRSVAERHFGAVVDAVLSALPQPEPRDCTICGGPLATGTCTHADVGPNRVTTSRASWDRLTSELSEARSHLEPVVNDETVERVAQAIYESPAYGNDGRFPHPAWDENGPGHCEFDRNQFRIRARAAIDTVNHYYTSEREK